MQKKILIIGMNRSGTKWLSNMLCKHSKIIGVQSQSHNGILETNMFGNLQNYFSSLDTEDEYIAFIEMWSQTDFFKSTCIDKSFFYDLVPNPKNLLDLFILLMNEYAKKNNKLYWLQKTSPLQYYYIDHSKIQPDYIITIDRDYFDVVVSTTVLRNRKKKLLLLLKSAFSYILQAKIIKKIKRNTYHVRYEDLVTNKKETLSNLCKYLNISYEPSMEETPYTSNSTWKKQQKIDISKTEKFTLYVFQVLKYLPYWLLMGVYKTVIGKPKWKIVEGTFRQVSVSNKNIHD